MSILGTIASIKGIVDVAVTVFKGIRDLIKAIWNGGVDFISSKAKQLGPFATGILIHLFNKEKKEAKEEGRQEGIDISNREQERVKNEANEKMLNSDIPTNRRDAISRLREGNG